MTSEQRARLIALQEEIFQIADRAGLAPHEAEGFNHAYWWLGQVIDGPHRVTMEEMAA